MPSLSTTEPDEYCRPKAFGNTFVNSYQLSFPLNSSSAVEATSQGVKWRLGPRFGRNIGNTTRCLGLAILVQVLCIGCSNWHPILELANHFAMHGLVLSLFITPFLFRFGAKRLGALLVFAVVYLATLTQPWSLLPHAASSSDAEGAVQVLCWNLLAKNTSYEGMVELVDQVDPDVLVLIEVAPSLLEQIPEIADRYPYSAALPALGGSGIAVFSRIPGTGFEKQDFDCAFQPAIVAKFPWKNSQTDLQIVALHPLSPIPVGRTKTRDQQLQAFLRWANDTGGPICVCGDFNTTPWTRSFQSLQDAGFMDSRLGVGNCPTWPSWLGPFGLPIDHALSKGSCEIFDREVIASSHGSDHLPLRFRLRPARDSY